MKVIVFLAAGLVERVVLLGTPIGIKDMNWEATRKVVAGRYVNVYSTNDWMLGIAFRAKYDAEFQVLMYLFLLLQFNSFHSFSHLMCLAIGSLLTQGLAGIQAVDVPGIENVGPIIINN